MQFNLEQTKFSQYYFWNKILKFLYDKHDISVLDRFHSKNWIMQSVFFILKPRLLTSRRCRQSWLSVVSILFNIYKLPQVLKTNSGVVFHCFLYSFEYRVVLLIDWLHPRNDKIFKWLLLFVFLILSIFISLLSAR